MVVAIISFFTFVCLLNIDKMVALLIKSCLTVISLLFGARICMVYLIWGKCVNKKSLSGKTVIITGASSGVGRELAVECGKRGARVLMACRQQHHTLSVIQHICQTNQIDGQLIFKHIDLESFDSVKRFAEDVIKNEKSIDILINNAGVFRCPLRLTSDGYETQFQVNHLSNALLTSLLLPKMMSSNANSDLKRIIMVTSTLYKRSKIDYNYFKKGGINSDNYDITNAYNYSKLANILFVKSLWNKIEEQNRKNVHIYIASPGIVWTNLNRHVKQKWWQIVLASPFAVLFLRTARQGSQTIVHCATSDSLVPCSLYRNCSEKSWNSVANDQQLQSKTYDLTMKAIESHLITKKS